MSKSQRFSLMSVGSPTMRARASAAFAFFTLWINLGWHINQWGYFMKGMFAALVVGMWSLNACAEGFYVAGDLGRSRLGYDDVYDTMFSVAGGYEFDLPFRDTFALEISYRDFGSIEQDYGVDWRSVEITAAQLSLVSRHKFNDQFSLLARFGGAELKQNDHGFYDGERFHISRSYEKMYGGLGARYALNEKLGLYMEYDWYDVKISGFLMGADYHF
jgi:hypothetical protein